MAELLDVARRVIDIEIAGLNSVASLLDNDFKSAVELIIQSEGRAIICGMGKSGIIGKKIAASLASTGTPSFFMHPGEAFHGDLGMVKPEDVFIAISNSGETEEVLKLLPFLKDNGNSLISITGNPGSTLAKAARCHLNVCVPEEACPLQLAPTSSTTATLVMGDALTVALMERRDFQPENFARFHPGGSLGRRLLRKVSDEMESGDLPFVSNDTLLIDALNIMTASNLGLCLVGRSDALEGVVTDGDLRRAVGRYRSRIFDIPVSEIVSRECKTVNSWASVGDAYEMMDIYRVNALVVLEEGAVVGVLTK